MSDPAPGSQVVPTIAGLAMVDGATVAPPAAPPGQDAVHIEYTLAESARSAVEMLGTNVDSAQKPVLDLLIAMARHVASLKWAVRLLEGRLALRDSLAITQATTLRHSFDEVLDALTRMRSTEWGMRRGDRPVFEAAVGLEINKVEAALRSVDEWYTIMTDPTFVFEREVLERLPLNDVLMPVVSEIESESDRRRVMLFIPDGLMVSTSAERLGVAMAALLDNALRYGGDSQVEVLAGLNEDQELWIEVADRGPGLQGRDPEKLWLSLSERSGLDDTGRADGLSLGLYLAKMMVESLNGVIEISDRDGGGLAARIFLPQRRRGDA